MNENVTLIPARRRTGNRIIKDEKPKLRVAAYCRVSTDSDEQAGSYETQVNHYTEYIGRNKDWELAGIYADDGISGTNTKKREGSNFCFGMRSICPYAILTSGIVFSDFLNLCKSVLIYDLRIILCANIHFIP